MKTLTQVHHKCSGPVDCLGTQWSRVWYGWCTSCSCSPDRPHGPNLKRLLVAEVFNAPLEVTDLEKGDSMPHCASSCVATWCRQCSSRRILAGVHGSQLQEQGLTGSKLEGRLYGCLESILAASDHQCKLYQPRRAACGFSMICPFLTMLLEKVCYEVRPSQPSRCQSRSKKWMRIEPEKACWLS